MRNSAAMTYGRAVLVLRSRGVQSTNGAVGQDLKRGVRCWRNASDDVDADATRPDLSID
jgi:hypothetical protein